MGIIFTGQWGAARRILASGAERVGRAVNAAVLQEAHYLRSLVVVGIREQVPGGKAFRPLAPMTIALRRFKNFRGTKALLVRGDLRNSISVKSVSPGVAFVGVLRTARAKDGQSLANVAELNEFGSRPIVVRITAKMRAYIAMAMRAAGQQPRGGGSGTRGTGIMVVRIPARPFFGPVLDQHFRPRDVERRFAARVGRLLAGDFGQLGVAIPYAGGPSSIAGGASSTGNASTPGVAAAAQRVKDQKRVAAATLGWSRRRARKG